MSENRDFSVLKEFIKLAKESGATELSYEYDDFKASVSFVSKGQSFPMMQGMPILGNASLEVSSESGVNSTSKGKNEKYIDIVSPFVGTFYRASSPSSPPYINVGDRISPGKVLCIIEAMKIMNEIESELSGEIVEVCVENDSFVEYGQVLFRVKP